MRYEEYGGGNATRWYTKTKTLLSSGLHLGLLNPSLSCGETWTEDGRRSSLLHFAFDVGLWRRTEYWGPDDHQPRTAEVDVEPEGGAERGSLPCGSLSSQPVKTVP